MANLRPEAVAVLVAGIGGQYRRLSRIDVTCRMGAPDIFVSYAREDQARVAPVVAALQARGWSVFWDRRIPAGQTWRSHIGRALEKARCVVVAWSEHAIRSEWVVEEADEGKRRGILVPVFLDPVHPPWGFRGIQAADLSGWTPGRSSPAFDSFLADLGVVLDVQGPQVALMPDVAPAPVSTLAADEDAINQSTAAEAPLTDCDRLAADPDDNQKHAHAPGVDFEDLDADSAILACKAALDRWPQEARFAYQYGLALVKAGDEAEAVAWFRKAAVQGHAAAQNSLGRMYCDGRGGLAEDEAEAARWFRKAAEQGYAVAQYDLGRMYESGRGGLARDEAEAVRWYRKAAEQGNVDAKNNLARLGRAG
jgi:TIR domain/Sel1 repeat